MADVIKQTKKENDTHTIVGQLMASRGLARQHDSVCTAARGICEMTATASPFIDMTLVGVKQDHEQAEVKRFFHCNLTPKCIKINDNNGGTTRIAHSHLQRRHANK
jgi:hypothetical protein